MPSFRNDEHLFAPVSVYRLHPAHITPGADWLQKPGDYNRGELKGNHPNFVQPVKPSDFHYDIPDELARVDPFKGLNASTNEGYDWYRHPEQFNKGQLYGLPKEEMAMLVPSHTQSYKVDHFESHFKTQNKIHPEAQLANAIPEAHANYQKKKMEEHLRQASLSAYADSEELARARTARMSEMGAPIHEQQEESFVLSNGRYAYLVAIERLVKEEPINMDDDEK